MAETIAVKERPILFSGEMVKAILDGRKTVTRRPVKAPSWSDGIENIELDYNDLPLFICEKTGCQSVLLCPYGRIGERLWVRETFSRDHANFYPHFPIIYSADGYDPRDKFESFQSSVYSPESKRKYRFAWKPSIFMRRADSRITLEITGVRVERLQEISDEDCRAEGPTPRNAGDFGMETWRSAFTNLWIDINGHGSWESNPWVWRIEFKPVEPST